MPKFSQHHRQINAKNPNQCPVEVWEGSSINKVPQATLPWGFKTRVRPLLDCCQRIVIQAKGPNRHVILVFGKKDFGSMLKKRLRKSGAHELNKRRFFYVYDILNLQADEERVFLLPKKTMSSAEWRWDLMTEVSVKALDD